MEEEGPLGKKKDVVTWWADRKLPNWRTKGKLSAPRICLAKLKKGRDLEEVNSYLRDAVPWSNTGTDIPILHKGDYDFTLVVLTAILHLFGKEDKVLFPETRSHILDELLTVSGPGGSLRVPFTFGLLKETENHILMTEGSRYLKNEWMKDNGSDDEDHDNGRNGLGRFLSDLLGKKRETGLDEYNSVPYIGYTLTALLNLHAFGRGSVRIEAGKLLDRLNLKYALSSLSFRRFPPFRRRLEYARDRELDRDYQSWMMRVWSSEGRTVIVDDSTPANEHSLMAAVIPYELPKTVRDALEGRARSLLRTGHGEGRSVEIYSKGPGYLLSAGGSRSRLLTIEVTRPITLILEDGASNLEEVLHLGRTFTRLRGWNQSGVSVRFAVSRGPLNVPDGWSPQKTTGGWKLFVSGELPIITYSDRRMGIIAIFPEKDPEVLLESIVELNADEKALRGSFRSPDGTVERYELSSPRDRYMIVPPPRSRLGRRFSEWPYWGLSSEE